MTASQLDAFSRVSLKTSRLTVRIKPGNFRVAMDICCALGHSISVRSLFYSRLVVIVKWVILCSIFYLTIFCVNDVIDDAPSLLYIAF